MSNTLSELKPATDGRRRRFTPEQKTALLREAARPGSSLSNTARQYGVAVSLLFQWKRLMDDATESSLTRDEKLVPESALKKAESRIRELERALGRATMKVEILEEAVKVGREKKTDIACTVAKEGSWKVTQVAKALASTLAEF